MGLINFIPIRYPKVFYKGLRRINKEEKTIYLSFDDGPTPIVTEQVLEILKKHNAKAIFFCTGINANKYPEIIEKIKIAGHSIGNHGYSHKNAFKTQNKDWLNDNFKESSVSDSIFFRPPYGKILPWQYLKIKKKHKIVFWDVLSFDYNEDYSIEKINSIIKKHTRNGSILVFHDKDKASKNMLPSLEYCLVHFKEKGFEFKAL